MILVLLLYFFWSLLFLGSLSDPGNISGLAHFCEHMLFLGTEKYPKENEYSQYLSEHAGSSNAFTSGEHTNYYFDVSHEHLEGALDRYPPVSVMRNQFFFLFNLFIKSYTETLTVTVIIKYQVLPLIISKLRLYPPV